MNHAEQLKPYRVSASEIALLMRLSSGPSRVAAYTFGPGWVELKAQESNRWAFEALAKHKEANHE